MLEWKYQAFAQEETRDSPAGFLVTFVELLLLLLLLNQTIGDWFPAT